MPNNNHASTSDAKSAVFKLLGIAFALLIVIIPVYAFNDEFVVGADWYFGTDTYMRMVRVNEWVRAISENIGRDSWSDLWPDLWYGNFSASSNWPYGQTLHWTRPLDIIIVAGGLLLAPITGIERGLYYSGVSVSPFLAMLSILILFRATRSFLDTRGQVSMAILVVAAPITKNYFYAARPDHHSLLVFLFAVVFSYLIIMLYEDDEGEDDNNGDKNIKHPIIAGSVAAVAVWTSVEALVTVAFGAGVIGFFWLIKGKLEYLGKLRWFLWGLALASIAAIALERPPAGWFQAVEYDRISIPHITLFLMLALVSELIWRIWKNKKTTSTYTDRFIGGTIMVALPAIILFLIFPNFFKGPFAGAMDIRLQEVWLNKIEELRPMFDGDVASVSLATMHLAPLLWVAWWLKKIRNKKEASLSDSVSANSVPSSLVLVIILGIIIFVPLSIYQVRWSAYLGIILAVPLASLAQMLFDFRSGPTVGPATKDEPGTPIFRVPIVASVFIAPALGALALTSLLTNETADSNASKNCKWSDVAPQLKKISQQNGRKINIMTRIHEGPEVLYRTGQNVVGTPHHRNTEGILDSFKVLASTNLGEAFSILSKRSIDYLAFCKDTIEERVYLNTPGETLTRMMVDGRQPKWLEAVTLPGDAGDRFYLFRFNEENR